MDRLATASFVLAQRPTERGPSSADQAFAACPAENKPSFQHRATQILQKVRACPDKIRDFAECVVSAEVRLLLPAPSPLRFTRWQLWHTRMIGRYTSGILISFHVLCCLQRGTAVYDLRLLTWILCGAVDPDVALPAFKDIDAANSCKCNTTWSGDHVAYRCNTCGIWSSSCMCVDCFDITEHQGHDFRMYSSSTGGCCDCGNAAAWKPGGFCKRHKAAAASAKNSVDLIGPAAKAGAEAAIGAVIAQLLPFWNNLQASAGKQATPDGLNWQNRIKAVAALGYTRWLCLAATVCEGFRSLISQAFMSTELPALAVNSVGSMASENGAVSGHRLADSTSFADVSPLGISLSGLVHYPHSLMTLSSDLHLTLLFNEDFKQQFTRAFVKVYPAVATAQLTFQHSAAIPRAAEDHDALLNYLDKIICQLFVDSDMVLQIDQETGFVRTMLSHVVSILQPFTSNTTVHFPPDFDDTDFRGLASKFGFAEPLKFRILRDDAVPRLCSPLYRLVSDLRYALGHSSVAIRYLFEDEEPGQTLGTSLMGLAVTFMSLFHGVYAHRRAQGEHVAFEAPLLTQQVYQIASVVRG